MIELYKYIQEGILGDIDDTLNTADENTDRYLIANWLNENTDFVSMFANRVSAFNASSKMRINSKNEIDVYEFRPLNEYSNSNKQKLDLPVPEYIKFNSVNTITMTGHNIDKLNMKLLPHFNYCDFMFVRSWDTDSAQTPDLASLDIDEIKTLYIDIENMHPASWPKSKITNTFLHTAIVRDYSINVLINYNLDYDIADLKGLHTNTLIIPDFFITNSAIKFGYGNEIVINSNDTYEYESLNNIFATKTFKNLYIYDATRPIDDCYAVKKKGNSYIISARRRVVNNMIY